MYRVNTHKKMQNRLIRVFVNENKLIEIHKYASVYSLKCEIVEKLYDNLTTDDIILQYNGLIIEDNKKCLSKYDIKDNSNITVNITLNGGSTKPTFYLKVMYIIALIVYILFLLSGLLPVVATGFSNIFQKTIKSLLGKHHEKGWVKVMFFLFVTIPSFLISTLAIPLFVWATSSYMIFPWLYSSKNDYCNSGLAAKDIGFYAMFVFSIIYGIFNIGNIVFGTFQNLIDTRGISQFKTAHGVLTTINTVGKTTVNSFRFIPLYILTLGSYKVIHDSIDTGINLLYQILDKANVFTCDDDRITKKICKFFTGVNDKVRQIKHLKKNESDNDLDKPLSTDIYETEEASIVIDHNAEKILEMLKIGFCLKANEGNKTYVSGVSVQEEVEAQFTTSVYCQLIEGFQMFHNVLDDIGNRRQVANMIKMGNLAGGATSIFLIIILIYTSFVTSFGKYKYG